MSKSAYLPNSSVLQPITPKCIYAKGDMKTGEKILVLEDLSAGIVAGYMMEGGEGSHPYVIDSFDTQPTALLIYHGDLPILI